MICKKMKINMRLSYQFIAKVSGQAFSTFWEKFKGTHKQKSAEKHKSP